MSTKPEVFIAECLLKKDEFLNKYEGKVLYDYLKMQGKNPIYCYFRTRGELVNISEAFAESGYRYLHISCHGGEECLTLPGDRVIYADFAELFKDTLTKKRIFISACEQGNIKFSNTLFQANSELLSFLAPINCPNIHDLTVFWISMYNRLHSFNERSIDSKALRFIVKRLSSTFGIPFLYSFDKDETTEYKDPNWVTKLAAIALEKDG